MEKSNATKYNNSWDNEHHVEKYEQELQCGEPDAIWAYGVIIIVKRGCNLLVILFSTANLRRCLKAVPRGEVHELRFQSYT